MDNNNKIKKYITLRTKEVALILASKEDMLEVAPEGDKKSLLIAMSSLMIPSNEQSKR